MSEPVTIQRIIIDQLVAQLIHSGPAQMLESSNKRIPLNKTKLYVKKQQTFFIKHVRANERSII